MKVPPTRYLLFQIVWGLTFSLAVLGAVDFLGRFTDSFALKGLTILLVAAAMAFLSAGPGATSQHRRRWSAPQRDGQGGVAERA